jgi:dTDP-4-dehydrorhamnose reductase
MKRILVLGASGLIGHKLFEKLGERFDDVSAVLHRDRSCFKGSGLFTGDNVIDNVDASDFPKLSGILHAVDPDVVLNCVGITKRKPEVNDALYVTEVNCMLPHRLAKWAGENGKRIIHFSTDCVFNGEVGDYTEESATNGPDAYGRTKAIGEIRYDHTLTIRSSFIGRELDAFSELLEWFIGQEGKTIKGFTNAFYSGVSTIFMSKVVGDIIESHPDISDLHQLAMPTPISKYDLLCCARDAFNMNVEIIPDGDFTIKPTLDGSKLQKKLNLEIPDWQTMMQELANETQYDYLGRTKNRPA